MRDLDLVAKAVFVDRETVVLRRDFNLLSLEIENRLVSAAMPLTMADGKVNATGNTKGQIMCVYRPGWIVGYRRRIAASMDYLPYYDSYQMTATVRLALAPLDTDVAAALYNVTV